MHKGDSMRRWGRLLPMAVLVLAGCKLFEKKPSDTGGGASVLPPGETSSRPKDPVGPHWLEQPSAAWDKDKTPASKTWLHPNDPAFDLKAESRGLLAGFVEDPEGRKAGKVYVQVQPTGDTGADPVGMATLPDGSFLLSNLKPGASYTLTARAKDGERSLVGRVITKAPNARIRIPLIEGEVTEPTKPVGTAPTTRQPDAGPPALIPPDLGPLPAPNLQSNGPRYNPGTGDLPSPVPLENDSRIFPATADDLPRGGGFAPGDSPTGLVPLEHPVRPIRPELSTAGPAPEWRGPAASIPRTGTTVPLPRNETRRTETVDTFRVVDSQGRTRTFPTGQPGGLLLVDFMTTSCLPCVKVIPVLTALQEKYAARGLDVIGITCDDEALKTRQVYAEKYRAKHDLNYAIYAEPGQRPGQLMKRFGIDRFPTAVLLDTRGAVLWQGNPSKVQDLVTAIEDNLRGK